MRKLIILAAAALTIGSCSKVETTGVIRYNCTSSNPYGIYLDNVSKGTLQGGTFTDITANKGVHTLKAIQLSGYVFTPTVVEKTINLDASGISFIFP